MSKKPLTQAEIELSLHELGQRLRAAWADRQADMQTHLAAFKETIRDEWGRERVRAAEPKIEPPKIEEPKIGPDKSDRKPEEPDMGR